MNNLRSYCGLVHARIRASDKDLPVTWSSPFFSLAVKRLFMTANFTLAVKGKIDFWYFLKMLPMKSRKQ